MNRKTIKRIIEIFTLSLLAIIIYFSFTVLAVRIVVLIFCTILLLAFAPIIADYYFDEPDKEKGKWLWDINKSIDDND